MCLIALALQQHPDWPIILIGNRDEFHARASSAASPWEDAPEILGGRDLDAGGTWLAVAPAAGRLGVVTNVREPMPPADALSRGLLVRDYLMGMQSADMYAKGLQAASYRPFNLLLLDDADAIYVTNRPAPLTQRLPVGLYGLSNGALDAPWPKTRQLKTRLASWLAGDATNLEPLFAALSDETRAADADLPDTGVGLERERFVAPAFIRSESYGTRAQTVVRIAADGRGELVERSFGPNGAEFGETRLSFRASPCR